MLVQRSRSFSPSVGFADSSPIRWSQETNGRNSCLPLTRKVSKPEVLTEGENYVSFEILNQWISKREFEISPNRTEIKKL